MLRDKRGLKRENWAKRRSQLVVEWGEHMPVFSLCRIPSMFLATYFQKKQEKRKRHRYIDVLPEMLVSFENKWPCSKYAN